MNRSVGLFGILLTIFVLIFLSLSIVVTSARANPGNLLVPKIDVEATAQAIQFENKRVEIEAAAQKRLASIQAQIDQRQQTLAELNHSNEAEITQLQTQVSNLQTQIEQARAETQQLQTTITQLEQTIKDDEAASQKELADEQFGMQQKETLLQNDLQSVSDQLQVVYGEIAKWGSLSVPPASENNDDKNADVERNQNDNSNEHGNSDKEETEGESEDHEVEDHD